MAKRIGLLMVSLLTLSGPSLADTPTTFGLKLDPLPPLVLKHLVDSDSYSHFECHTEAGPEAAGLYPVLDKYPEFQAQEAYSSPNGAFPDSHETFGGPPEQGDPGPLPTP